MFPTDEQVVNLEIRESSAREYAHMRGLFFDWIRLREQQSPVKVLGLKTYLMWMIWAGYGSSYVASAQSVLIKWLASVIR